VRWRSNSWGVSVINTPYVGTPADDLFERMKVVQCAAARRRWGMLALLELRSGGVEGSFFHRAEKATSYRREEDKSPRREAKRA
jgi:hypothetical protein